MGFKVVSALALALLVGVISGSPFDELRSNFELRDTNLDEPAYRLRDVVQPRTMDVDLDVYVEELRFNGLVQIVVEVQEANLTQIVLHQNVGAITAVSVLDVNNEAVALQSFDPFETDAYYEILKINMAEPISVGTYTLIVTYQGIINENPFDRGFYRGYYFLNGQIRYYATTQFQPYHARKAFPCFDEPQFKARFTISITRPSDFSPSYSNMAINNTQTVAVGRVRETFLPTPLVSAYLVAFHVSDFIETTSTSTAARPFGIISRPGGTAITSQHAYSADMGVRITSWMDTYFNISYYDMGQGQPMKNDHIALPDFPSGAMENWGMVNYREAYLLYDPQHTNEINRIYIATILSHELAHKWFGNMVTCFWWSNLWLNESFASFFEYFATHGADPTLELADQFIVDYVHSALASDAAAGATPMNWTGVVTNPSITAHFSTTSYAKGASVLRMMEHLVGPSTFQKALYYYLRDNAYELGTPELMYAAFRTAVSEDSSMSLFPGVDVGAVFDSWVQNAGAPVVTVNVNHETGDITVSQQRYQLTGTRPDTLWHIPLTWTREGSASFASTAPVAILSTQSMTLQKPAGEEWVIFNIAQSGYYRVNYDDRTWELIAEALLNDRESIHYLNRAQIVNDVLYFIRSGDLAVERAFQVLEFLSQETDYYVWAGALGQLDWQRRRMEHIPALHQEFTNYILESMEAVIQDLGYNEATTDSSPRRLNRILILNYACNYGHAGCIADSTAKWTAFRNNPTSLVQVNLRRHVYCVGLRQGDDSDYQFLWELYSTSENTADMVVMLRTLACSRNQDNVLHYMQQTTSNNLIRSHDKTNAFSFALAGNPDNLQTVLDYVYSNYATIRETYGGTSRLIIALNALAAFLTDFQDIVAFQTWLYSNQLNLTEEFATGTAVINAAVANLEWGNNVALDVHGYLRARSGAATMVAPIALLLAALVAQLLR